jgi:hypothetical protein
MVKKDPTNNYGEIFIHTACFQKVKNEPHQVIVHIIFDVQSKHAATFDYDCLWVLKSTVSHLYCSSQEGRQVIWKILLEQRNVRVKMGKDTYCWVVLEDFGPL